MHVCVWSIPRCKSVEQCVCVKYTEVQELMKLLKRFNLECTKKDERAQVHTTHALHLMQTIAIKILTAPSAPPMRLLVRFGCGVSASAA